jgi:protein arginine kinase activator
MKCDYCDSKATVFLTQLAEGQMKKVCLCDSCAKERGVTDPTGFSLADMLVSNFQDPPSPDVSGKRRERTAGGAKVCPECGFTAEDFQKVRRFGCGNCYQVFNEELAPMLRGMHKGLSHIGKVPEGLMESHFRHKRLEELHAKLEQAIASESYEDAADIRDEIQTLDEVGK